MCGFELARGPLARMFDRDGIDDPLIQKQIALDVIERVMHELDVLTKPRTLH